MSKTETSGKSRRARTYLRSMVSLLALALAAGLWAGSATAQDDAEGEGEAEKPKQARFSHEQHDEMGVELSKCSTCHKLDSKYKASPPTSGKDHMPCATSGCHFEEFFATEPVICTVCHESSDPRVEQKPIIRVRLRSEFAGSGLSHQSHVKLVGKKGNAACMRCHGNKYDGQDRPKTGGHSACAGCHAKNNEPRMSSCGSCHALGGKSGKEKRAEPSEWNVRAKFTHDSHGRDPRKSQPTSCVSCHRSVPKASTLAEVKPPKMEYCDGCHDGNHAFKTTGFGCHRCHGGKADE